MKKKTVAEKIEAALAAGLKPGDQIPNSESFLNKCHVCPTHLAVNHKYRRSRVKCPACSARQRREPCSTHTAFCTVRSSDHRSASQRGSKSI